MVCFALYPLLGEVESRHLQVAHIAKPGCILLEQAPFTNDQHNQQDVHCIVLCCGPVQQSGIETENIAYAAVVKSLLVSRLVTD